MEAATAEGTPASATGSAGTPSRPFRHPGGVNDASVAAVRMRSRLSPTTEAIFSNASSAIAEKYEDYII